MIELLQERLKACGAATALEEEHVQIYHSLQRFGSLSFSPPQRVWFPVIPSPQRGEG